MAQEQWTNPDFQEATSSLLNSQERYMTASKSDEVQREDAAIDSP